MQENWVAESNVGIKIFTGGTEVTISAHVHRQYSEKALKPYQITLF